MPVFIFPLMVLAAAAYRPAERSPEITQALNDLFWLTFVGIVGTIVLQAVVLAVASFADRTEPATFPRWYGYLNIVSGLRFWLRRAERWWCSTTGPWLGTG